jgi:hypothetical protein
VLPRALGGLALVLALSSAARGQQPFATDDADVTPKGWVHFEAFDEYDWLQPQQAPHLRQNTFNMRVNYGLGKGLELDVDSPLITIVNDATAIPRQPSGIGDTNFGLKWNIREERDGSRSPAFATALYIEVPTGNTSTDIGSGRTDVWLYGIMQKTLVHDFILRANAGYLITGNTSTGVVGITTVRGEILTGAASIAHNVSERISIGVEISAARALHSDVDRDQLQWLVGGNYALGEHSSLDFGVIAGHYTASPRAGLQIGFSLDLPRAEVR